MGAKVMELQAQRAAAEAARTQKKSTPVSLQALRSDAQSVQEVALRLLAATHICVVVLQTAQQSLILLL